jgi:hypothetical protein
MLEELEWIYKSWIFSKSWEMSDLVIVCHPRAVHRIPSDPGLKVIAAEPVAIPGSRWEGYPFINSIACLSGPHTDGLQSEYKWLLRTDADVFLTTNFAKIRPSFPIYGRGHYAGPYQPQVWDEMIRFCDQHGVKHRRVFNCGHSLFATSDRVLSFLKRQTFWSSALLDHFERNGAGEWPGWCKNVITMYAAEITANENYEYFLENSYQRILDVESDRSELLDTLVLHIHAIHTDGYFSKFHFREGAYAGKQHNRETISGYCHFIAATDIRNIKTEVCYPY